jgi:fatty acid desaturase
MNAFIDFSSSWYVLFFGFLAAWAVLMVARRKFGVRHEVKEQMFLAFGGMIAMGMMELFAVSTGLWNYTPGNWPVILWPTYFVAILFGYQLLRSVERVLLRRTIVV